MQGVKSGLLSACVAVCGLAVAQAGDTGPAFEVASIKATDPNPGNAAFIGMSADGAMVKYTNITLRDCIRGAYRARDFQIVGPDWMTKARFEINAKLPPGASSGQIPEMLQALLAERFKLEIRREQKEQNVYALVVGNEGPKLKTSEIKPDPNSPQALGPDGRPRPMMMYSLNASRVTLTAPSATLAGLVDQMSRFTARPIVDMTGIRGQYQFNLNFAPERDAGPPTGAGLPGNVPGQSLPEPAQSVFDSVRQYGLRLEARKAPVEMFVVTHIEKTPTDN
jgi:uncharacterized protein (TIGR03435 family)